MKLDEKLKQKITYAFLKRMGEPVSLNIDDIYIDLLGGMHSIDITICEKFTIAEVKYFRNGYDYHFLGISAKNPNDVENRFYGIKVAAEEALLKLLVKFYFNEINLEIKIGR
jgi:hypothetical protein